VLALPATAVMVGTAPRHPRIFF